MATINVTQLPITGTYTCSSIVISVIDALNLVSVTFNITSADYINTNKVMNFYLEYSRDFIIGSTQNITWNFPEVLSNIQILLSRNNGSTWETITSATPNTGNYNWIVTGPTTSASLIKINGMMYTNPNDGSQINFSDISSINAIPFYIKNSTDSNVSWSVICGMGWRGGTYTTRGGTVNPAPQMQAGPLPSIIGNFIRVRVVANNALPLNVGLTLVTS